LALNATVPATTVTSTSAPWLDHAADSGRQHVDKKCHAEILAAGKRAGGAKEARTDHQAAATSSAHSTGA